MKKILASIFFILLTLTNSGYALGQETTVPTAQESVRDKVKEKVDLVRKNPVAYIGTVTDITESTIQLKSTAGEIQQISTSKFPVVYVKSGKTPKEIKFSEIAIGDYIAAMGFTNGNKVLDAKRVLVTDAPDKFMRKAYFLEVVENQDKVLLLKNLYDSKGLTLKPAKKFRVTSQGRDKDLKLVDIKKGDKITAFGVLVDEILEARRIHVLSLTIPVSSPKPSPSPSPSPSTNPSPSPKVTASPKA